MGGITESVQGTATWEGRGVVEEEEKEAAVEVVGREDANLSDRRGDARGLLVRFMGVREVARTGKTMILQKETRELRR